MDVAQQPHSIFGHPVSPLGGFLVFGGLGALLMACSWVLLQRRDA
jgi:hypothetical protein